jgi:hypothetical protein
MKDRTIKFYNEATRQEGCMNGTLRQAVLQAYATYELGDIITGDLEAAYGHLVTEDTKDRAALGNWVTYFLD